jgi:hypothetical protein
VPSSVRLRSCNHRFAAELALPCLVQQSSARGGGYLLPGQERQERSHPLRFTDPQVYAPSAPSGCRWIEGRGQGLGDGKNGRESRFESREWDNPTPCPLPVNGEGG